MNKVRLITTSDGSHSLLHTTLNETYHSVHGAIRESQHVFIQNGFDHWIESKKTKEIRILEIGFGTGLNAFLTLLRSGSLGVRVFYESWEAYPLAAKLIQQLNYSSILGCGDDFTAIHLAPWNEAVSIGRDFTLVKYQGDVVNDVISPEKEFDVVFYDAFAPAKQPEIWTIDVLEKVVNVLVDAGCFVTYCAKGQLKRDLKMLGLTVETLSGPPGKKEMTRATVSRLKK